MYRVGYLRTVLTTALILPVITTPTSTKPITRLHPSMSKCPFPAEIQRREMNARMREMGSSSAVIRCFPTMRRKQDQPEVRMRYIQYRANICLAQREAIPQAVLRVDCLVYCVWTDIYCDCSAEVI